ncbi:DUF1573 domain-containing protein [Flavobacterium sp.]|uniref:DUF1573 domain-containing protein n=1 Tax=Flavobacterium sp. TaxID=239 RepID=UPI002B4B8D71|nr:DUF1573 domain-containing protein [Flavobacterium sp.]HLP64382.1 DUF1573 domain-containing protein [Flavobacterium sp.]
MNSKKIYFFMIAGLALLSGCKQEDNASAKIDANAQEIAPASPDAVAPVATPVAQPTQPTTDGTTANPNAQQATTTTTMPPAKTTNMVFNKKEHDFGEIKQGDKVNYTFTFKNTGNNDLTITSAQGSCGCTVPEYDKNPIKPGKSGKMKVSFDSTGKTGVQTKTVTVRANTPTGYETINIKATIKGGEPKIVSNTTSTTGLVPMPAPNADQPKN